jgi:hypothetical protein
MKTKPAREMADDLRPEYDLRQLLRKGIRGKYAKRCPAGARGGASLSHGLCRKRGATAGDPPRAGFKPSQETACQRMTYVGNSSAAD